MVSLLRYGKIIRELKRINSNIFFVFPGYQIGGAERVHADIMALVADQRPTCIITELPINSGFKKDFYEAARVIELKRWGTKKAFVPIMAKNIAKVINRQNKPVVFGCNSDFLYTLTNYLDENVEVIDLTHAFTPNLMGMEFYSLPYVRRINQRIVIGEKTKNDYMELYQKNGISLDYMERFKIIPNQIDAPKEYTKRDYSLPLTAIFVSRNSPEKRPEVFLELAKKARASDLSIRFIMVGDFGEYQAEYGEFIDFIGPVTDKHELNDLYEKSDIILITSVLEGFPMVLLEGMALGVVPISTAVGEIPSLIGENRKTGHLITNFEDTEKLVQSFLERLKACTEDLNSMAVFSRQAHSLVKKEFGAEKFAKNYRNLLKPHFKQLTVINGGN